MTRLKVNPTRMNLSILKDKLDNAARGHKLLKDKQDELMRQFITLIKENKKLRLEVEEKLQNSFKAFLMASAAMSQEMLEEAISLPTMQTLVEIKKKNVMSVDVPEMEFITKKTSEDASRYPYGYAQTTSDLDYAIDDLTEVMEELLTLTQKEKAAQLLANEIEKTRRRVNALEYKTIPDLEETIKYIRSKLDESERANITRLMKVKDIISKDEMKEEKLEKVNAELA
ncbi:V-type ATP synthase subunit D [Peptoniphilus grossensis]|uniref:V-type ATP synthase subunit D n=1 Tax=Peptoniphilus grossensis TaxID=1465756 RepID=UPI004068021B